MSAASESCWPALPGLRHPHSSRIFFCFSRTAHAPVCCTSEKNLPRRGNAGRRKDAANTARRPESKEVQANGTDRPLDRVKDAHLDRRPQRAPPRTFSPLLIPLVLQNNNEWHLRAKRVVVFSASPNSQPAPHACQTAVSPLPPSLHDELQRGRHDLLQSIHDAGLWQNLRDEVALAEVLSKLLRLCTQRPRGASPAATLATSAVPRALITQDPVQQWFTLGNRPTLGRRQHPPAVQFAQHFK